MNMVLEKSCGAIVYTIENGEIKYLLVEEKSGFHSFPKGHTENEESEEETALREIREETDLEVELITDFRVSDQYAPAEKPGVTKQVVYFIAKYSGQKPCVVRPNEIKALKSLRLEDALKILEHENEREILKQADDHIKNI
ncbi:MAG: NUDIX domain-containing protein [Ruminococcus sp.]|nr:NUDIX domain-containing protein [Ruminococcus sp.]